MQAKSTSHSSDNGYHTGFEEQRRRLRGVKSFETSNYFAFVRRSGVRTTPTAEQASLPFWLSPRCYGKSIVHL
jgi:hypothetical protein